MKRTGRRKEEGGRSGQASECLSCLAAMSQDGGLVHSESGWAIKISKIFKRRHSLQNYYSNLLTFPNLDSTDTVFNL